MKKPGEEKNLSIPESKIKDIPDFRHAKIKGYRLSLYVQFKDIHGSVRKKTLVLCSFQIESTKLN